MQRSGLAAGRLLLLAAPCTASARTAPGADTVLTGTAAYGDWRFVAVDAGVWGGPVGAAVAKRGSLLVSDDAGGTVWRVTCKAE